MLHDAEFWVGVAFVIFLAIAWKAGAFDTLLGGLDKRGALVRAELDEARRLRAEADRLLTDFTRRKQEAEREAEALVTGARAEAERVSREAHERAAEFVRRRTAAAELKIAQAEAQASQQVRDAAAEAAIRVSETILRGQTQGDAGQELIRRGLGEVRSRLHS